MTFAQILFALGLAFCGAGLTMGLRPTSTEMQQSVVSSTIDTEVSDLIARLAPLSKEPDGAWYSTGLTIKFAGKNNVEIELKTPSGDEYHGKASNLRDAARRITEPSNQIREALKGWGETSSPAR